MDNIINTKKLKNIKKARNLYKEKFFGNIEYKLHLCRLSEKKIQKYASQMKFRLYEGDGKCIYNIGYNDNGFPVGLNKEEIIESFKNINKIVNIIKTNVISFKVFVGSVGYVLNIYIKYNNVLTENIFFI